MNPALKGKIEERQNHSRHLMTESEARGILFNLEREVPSKAKRKKQALFFSKNIAGKLSPEAVALYRLYAENI